MSVSLILLVLAQDAQQSAREWFKQNNKWGAESDLFKEFESDSSDAVKKSESGYWVVGEGLMTSGSSHLLCSFEGEFLTMPLSKEEAAAFECKERSKVFWAGGAKGGSAAKDPVAKLNSVAMDGKSAWDGSAALKGKVKYERLREPKDDLVLRVTFERSGWSKSMFFYPSGSLEANGSIEFEFGAINPAESPRE